MSERDQRTVIAAQLIKRIRDSGVVIHVPDWIDKGYYVYPTSQHQADEATQILCDFCKRVGEEWIYNARSRLCRDVANWYEDHKVQDAKQEKRS